mgnify:CR=1 FL=1
MAQNDRRHRGVNDRCRQQPGRLGLAAQCGLATRFTAESHPSLPNYIAATSGGTQGVMDDASPAAHPLDVPSIFSQVKDIGKTWRSYQESSPGNCSRESSNPYA